MLRAFLIAPLVTPLLYWAEMVLEALADPARQPGALQNALGGLAIVYAFGGPIAYAATAVAGLPMYHLLRRRHLHPALVVGLGALAGAVVAWGLGPWLRGELFSVRLGVWRGALLGGVTAAVWWRMLPSFSPRAGRVRPSRTHGR